MKASRYAWQRALVNAIWETNSEKLAARIANADDAVFYRLFKLENVSGADEERLALEDALEDIRLLREHAFRLAH